MQIIREPRIENRHRTKIPRAMSAPCIVCAQPKPRLVNSGFILLKTWRECEGFFATRVPPLAMEQFPPSSAALVMMSA